MEVEEERRLPLWQNLKQRLRWKGMGCCGPSWAHQVSDLSIREDEDEEDARPHNQQLRFFEEEEDDGDDQIPAAVPSVASNMNLAAALAAERHVRVVGQVTVAPLKSLMRLFEETDGLDLKNRRGIFSKGESRGGGGGGGGVDGVCCVCMERDKGAAFIPCGHTYCRACSRELWLNRGICPLCNRSITEILDIF